MPNPGPTFSEGGAKTPKEIVTVTGNPLTQPVHIVFTGLRGVDGEQGGGGLGGASMCGVQGGGCG